MRQEVNGKVFYEDNRGRMIPEELVKDYDKLKDQVVMDSFEGLKDLRQHMLEVKAQVMEDIYTLVQMSAERYGVSLGGDKGNVTVSSYDGRVKLVIAVNEYQSFNENIRLAKQVIDQCIEKWSEGANANLRTVIDQAFAVNQSGRFNVASIMGLRRLAIDDPDWHKAMEIIADSIETGCSRKYFRVYTRPKMDDPYNMVQFDLANL